MEGRLVYLCVVAIYSSLTGARPAGWGKSDAGVSASSGDNNAIRRYDDLWLRPVPSYGVSDWHETGFSEWSYWTATLTKRFCPQSLDGTCDHERRNIETLKKKYEKHLQNILGTTVQLTCAQLVRRIGRRTVNEACVLHLYDSSPRKVSTHRPITYNR